jgi:hypothetical protein
MQEDPPEGVNATPLPDNIMIWHGIIFGYPIVIIPIC